MTCAYQVTCITRAPAPTGTPQQVTHLGGQNPLGRTWRLTLTEAIDGIINGKWSFFVIVGGVKRNLVIAVNGHGKYLKTDIDPIHPQVLLSLPDCPPTEPDPTP